MKVAALRAILVAAERLYSDGSIDMAAPPPGGAIASSPAALRDAGIDRAAFEAVLAGLKADKSMKSAAVAEIARRYTNTVTKYKSIAAAHAEISTAFTQQARFANKIG